MIEKEELATYYDVWKMQDHHEYYLGDEDNVVMVVLTPNNILLHPQLPSEKEKELIIRVRVDMLLSKATSNQREFRALKSIPDQIGVGFMPYFSSIDVDSLEPESLKSMLFESFRLYDAYKRVNQEDI